MRIHHPFGMQSKLHAIPKAVTRTTASLILSLAFILSAMPAASASAAEFGMCSGPDRAARKVTCLVDGDTGWEQGVKWRLEGVDTPEYAAHAECPEEPERAAQATMRMLELMQRGYEINWLGEKGGAGRDLVRIKLADGRDAGAVLIEDGFAVDWPHVPRVWCNAP